MFSRMMLSALAALTLGPAACAQDAPRVRTDREVYAEPELPKLPKAGETFVDPTFGTTILRVTDESDGPNNHNAYSYWPTFNRDSTRFHISRSGVPTLYGFDPKELKILGRGPLFAVKTPAGAIPRWENSIWSALDTDVIFAHEGSRLWSCNVAKKEYALLKDFNESFAGPVGLVITQISRSDDDAVFAFSLKGPDGKDAGCAAWRRADDKVLFHRGVVGSLDEVQVDKSGKWLLIKERKGEIESWAANLQTGHVEGITDGPPDFGPGHSDNGRGFVVGAENHQNRILYRDFKTPHKFHTVLDMGRDWSQPYHVSLLADDDKWTLVSNYPKQSTPGVFHGEIFLIANDGSGKVRRLCHHRTVYRGYWDSPRANISRDGRLVCFTSTWGRSDRRDVFILAVPPEDEKKDAAPALKTDLNVYPVPDPPALPAAGETFVDPTFGTTIMRATDETDGDDCKNVYSYWHSFNKNSTRLILSCGGKMMLYGFDPDAFKLKEKTPLFPKNPPGGGAPRWDDPMWSGGDPDMLYCHEGVRLFSYNVKTKEYALLRDFKDILPPGHLWQMSKSLDDKTFAFTVKDPKWRVMGYLAWNRDKDKVLLKEDLPNFDEVQLDKAGRWLVIKTGRQGRDHVIRVRIADLETGKIEDLTDYAPDWAPGHSDNGHGIVVGVDAHTPRYTLRKLDDPHRFTVILKWGDDWSQGCHISMLADDESWALVGRATGNKLASNGLLCNEIFQVATDGSGKVRRLCHHHAVEREYWDSPRANISRDGRFVCFTSNWGGTKRRDAFIVSVPGER